jgi:predicted ATP-grasp superfamily ATP-dependent carboligase
MVESEAQLQSLPANLFAVASPLLLQQWVPGGDDAVYFCLVQYDQNGKVANWFCGRKLMQWPPLGGSTAITISDELDETRDLTIAIFDAVKYQGLGSMEYKKDPRDGSFYIMEPTVGRNDFQSYLAVTGGVNLTRYACDDMLGRAIESKPLKKTSAWYFEPSVWYGLKYYLRKKDYFLLKHLASFWRKPAFVYLSLTDIKPLIALIKSRFR